uniref:Uncharacterized protein n=1 Tax=Oryza barthii TaxID=65489 RepID=A0A0D3HU25_9ORYZ
MVMILFAVGKMDWFVGFLGICSTVAVSWSSSMGGWWTVMCVDFPLPIALVEISGRCKTNDHGKKDAIELFELLGTKSGRYLYELDSHLDIHERTYGLVWVLETGGVAERLMMNVVFFMGDGDLVVLVFDTEFLDK